MGLVFLPFCNLCKPFIHAFAIDRGERYTLGYLSETFSLSFGAFSFFHSPS